MLHEGKTELFPFFIFCFTKSTMETQTLGQCHLTMHPQPNVRRAVPCRRPFAFNLSVFACFVCACLGFFVCSCVSQNCPSWPQSTWVPKKYSSATEEEPQKNLKIRNLGLGAKNRNGTRPLAKVDSATVLRKLNYVDNDALVQLYYLWMREKRSTGATRMHSCL